jgi:hypothetical protein
MPVFRTASGETGSLHVSMQAGSIVGEERKRQSKQNVTPAWGTVFLRRAIQPVRKRETEQKGLGLVACGETRVSLCSDFVTRDGELIQSTEIVMSKSKITAMTIN